MSTNWVTGRNSSLAMAGFFVLASLLLGPLAKAAEQRVSIPVSDLAQTVNSYKIRVRAAEVKLKDGSIVRTKLLNPVGDVLNLDQKAGAGIQTIPFSDVQSIRLDLGPRRGWQIADAIIFGLAGNSSGFWRQVVRIMELTLATELAG